MPGPPETRQAVTFGVAGVLLVRAPRSVVGDAVAAGREPGAWPPVEGGDAR